MHTMHMPELANFAVYLMGRGDPVVVRQCEMGTSNDGELTFSDDSGVKGKFAAGTWQYVMREPA